MHAIFQHVNLDNLQVIGCGAYNVCFTDGTYAIKIGTQNEYDTKLMCKAYESGIGIQVIDIAYRVELPEEIMCMMLDDNNFMAFGCKGLPRDLKEYFYANETGHADVLITELVTPCLDHKIRYDQEEQENWYALSAKLAEKFRNGTIRIHGTWL